MNVVYWQAIDEAKATVAGVADDKSVYTEMLQGLIKQVYTAPIPITLLSFWLAGPGQTNGAGCHHNVPSLFDVAKMVNLFFSLNRCKAEDTAVVEAAIPGAVANFLESRGKTGKVTMNVTVCSTS